MLTVLEVIKKTAEFFTAKGIASPRLNAELLVGHALGLPRMQLYVQFERVLAEAEVTAIRELVRRRGRHEPLQYILGTVDFYGLKLKADPRALIPRPETERLVEILLERAGSEAPRRVLDLGTGTGAIALALAQAWPAAAVTAVDVSAPALALAGENRASTGMEARVTLLESDWFGAIPAEARFDLIESNPPYLSGAEWAQAGAEVRDHEPNGALVAAEEGLAAARAILRAAPSFLAPGAWLALETGAGQHRALAAAAAQTGWARTESLADLTGRDRYLLAWPGTA